ncbi:beta-1,4-N-acetylgalactosaminyltransferase bre-4-like [Ischnura elegans]|uniref:beta-1,4-N-acetylgalactosaminyltransferase bre-4-like n=1 Tax=Ischnura elegans TaxID=197161 RepID=UPI001ED8BEC2|nr:beta-1,4-N-acetylgalactosaminyltransferase bre-4-like [Ischnura elegans]XP_046405282.1 beta-1,4-N-acetylgalactosaminyltransferase bre-4-like [Ischnura elegans]
MTSPTFSWLCLHHYKVLVSVVLALLILQYAISAIFDARHFEPLFTIANHSSGRGGMYLGSMGRNIHEMPPLLAKGVPPLKVSTPPPPPRNATSKPSAGVPWNVVKDVGVNAVLNQVDSVHNLSAKPSEMTEPSTEASVLCSDCNEEEEKIMHNSSTVTHPVTSPPTTGLPLCPPIPPNLVGPLEVTKRIPSVKELEKGLEKILGPDLGGLDIGGHGKPRNCQARNKVAIIVPYRDRAEHLRALLLNLHPLLQKQQVDYGIFVIEQAGTGHFNRAMLMNVGFVEASKLYDFDCFIFHDVDLLPEDDRNLYTCPEQPRHMSASIDVFKYKLPYPAIFGGVSAMTAAQFRKVNGFSNMFWGWGGEDDDMANRIKYHHFHISRYPANIARYKMISHKKEKANPKRYEYLYSGQNRFKTDGLSSLRYERKDIQLKRLYTWIYVELAAPS